MAAPVINSPQSVLEYLQWQTFEFQPSGLNTPTLWDVSPLPPGVTLNTATGRISGAAERPGVYDLIFTAVNSDGPSEPALFTLGIEAGSFAPPVDAIDLTIDLGSGLVSASPSASTTPSTNVVPGADVQLAPLFWLKRGDARLFHVRLVKWGVASDLTLASLKFALKALEPEKALVSSTAFARVGTGADTFYRVAVVVSGADLDGELSNDEDDAGTQFAGLAEFEWTWANPYGVGPDPLRSSTLNFAVGVARDLIANA